MSTESIHPSTNGKSLDLASPATESDASIDGKVHLSQLISDVQHLATLVASLAGDKATQLAAEVGARVQTARLSVTRLSDSVVQQTLRSAKATDGLVRARPWQSIGIAAAVGLLAGLVISRRR